MLFLRSSYERLSFYDRVLKFLVRIPDNAWESFPSLPGVPRVILARSPVARCLWVLVCLSCTTMFIIGATDLLRNYFSYPKKVNARLAKYCMQVEYINCQLWDDKLPLVFYISALSNFFEIGEARQFKFCVLVCTEEY